MRSLQRSRLASCVFGSLALLLSQGAGRAAPPPAEAPATETAAEQVVRVLERQGVTKVFGVPGEETLALQEALRKSKHVEFVLAASEQGAAFMASGYARATGKVGVVVGTLGPGATNLVTGAFEAATENVRLLVITGQAPTGRPLGYHQMLSTPRLFASIPLASREPERPGEVADALVELLATGQRTQKPVHLSLRADVAWGNVPVRHDLGPIPPTAPSPPDPVLVRRAATLLRGAERPVLVVGNGALQGDVRANVRAILATAASLGIPVVPTPMARRLFPAGDHRWIAPPLDASATGPGGDLVRQADLIVSVGLRPTEINDPAAFNRGDRAAVVRLDSLPLERPGQVIEGMRPGVEIVSSIAEALGSLARGVGRRSASEAWRNSLRRARAARAAEIRRATASTSPQKGTVAPQRVVSEIAAAFGRRSGEMIVDIGSNKQIATHFFPVTGRHKLVIHNGASTMGSALPDAIGAKLARPGQAIVSLSGDGGFLMTGLELTTAVKQKLPLVHVVLLDGELTAIRLHQERDGHLPAGITLPRLDIPSLAKGMGARGLIARTPAEVRRYVREGLGGRGPVLIGVRIPAPPAPAPRSPHR